METKKIRNKYTTGTFVEALKKTNPHDIDYSEVVFTKTKDKIKLKCNVCNTTFFSVAKDVLEKSTGCNECRKTNLKSIRIRPWPDVEVEFKATHGEKYQYDGSTYISTMKDMKMFCSTHGEFWQTPNNHIRSNGCYRCGRDATKKKRALSEEEFFQRSSTAHDNYYKYIPGTYSNCSEKIEIICPKHGSFLQVAGDHLQGHGCVKCFSRESKPQLEMQEFIESLGVKTVSEFRMNNGRYVDILCLELNIGFEFNGLKWHTEKYNKDWRYHLDKTENAKQQGIRLIHIYEDEWGLNKLRTQNVIKTILGKNELKYNARKLNIVLPNWEQTSDLLNSTHLQGAGIVPEFSIGLANQGNELLAVMCFDSRNVRSDSTELVRFCSKGIIRGGFSKLLSSAIPLLQKDRIISFSEIRFSNGSVYSKNGFTNTRSVKPSYWYIENNKRANRRAFQKQYLKDKFQIFDPNLTESENCKNNGLYRLWDCGRLKWELEIKKAS